MLHGEVAENVIATVATIMWSTQMVPQGSFPRHLITTDSRLNKIPLAWKAYKEKSVEGVSLYMMIVWAIGGTSILDA